jgi:hypothetical protein
VLKLKIEKSYSNPRGANNPYWLPSPVGLQPLMVLLFLGVLLQPWVRSTKFKFSTGSGVLYVNAE